MIIRICQIIYHIKYIIDNIDNNIQRTSTCKGGRNTIN